MDRSDLTSAPELLRTVRLDLHAPRPEFGPLFVASLNRSLTGLSYIGWAQQLRTVAWGVDFMVKGRESIAAGEGLIYYAFEREGAYVGRIDLHSWDFSVPRCEIGYVGDVLSAGRGLMREAALACVDLALQLGAVRVQALSESTNQRALHFAQHGLGFRREGELQNYERDAQGRLGIQVVFAAVRSPTP